MNIVQHPFGNLHDCQSKRGTRLGWASELQVVQITSLPKWQTNDALSQEKDLESKNE